MYGNNFRPIIMPNNIPFNPYNSPITNPTIKTSSIRNFFKGTYNLNWTGMLNNVSKTLGVVREAIPVVKEVGPMVNNMRSMIKIASVFKDETDTKKTSIKEEIKQKENSTNSTITNKTYNNYHDELNFFL